MFRLEHRQTERDGVFIAFDGERQAGLMSYVLFGEQMAVEHTEVEDEFRGLGVGKQLFDAVIAFADECGYRIDPVCPYVRYELEKLDRESR